MGREEAASDFAIEPLLAPPGEPASSRADALEIVRTLANRARRDGKLWTTGQELLSVSRPGEADGLDVRRVGAAMASLGVPKRRIRVDGVLVRKYALTTLPGG